MGYYTGSVTYPDSTVHQVFGFLSDERSFLLKEVANSVGYRLVVGADLSFGELVVRPALSNLYLKHIFDPDFQAQAPHFAAALPGTSDVIAGNADPVSNLTQAMSGNAIIIGFNITDSNAAYSGHFLISLTLSDDPNQAVALSDVSPILGTAWSTTDAATGLSEVLNGISVCSDPTNAATCSEIFGVEAGGNGNPNLVGTDGNYCQMYFDQVSVTPLAGWKSAVVNPNEDCSENNYGEGGGSSFAWISVDSGGNRTLHTMSFIGFLEIMYDEWTPAGTTTYVPQN